MDIITMVGGCDKYGPTDFIEQWLQVGTNMEAQCTNNGRGYRGINKALGLGVIGCPERLQLV